MDVSDLAGAATRVGAFAQNALEVLRFGGLQTDDEPTPYEVVHEDPVHRLRRYRPRDAPPGERPPVVLVPPMMLAAEVYDVSRTSSAVGALADRGVDPWVVDFGAPETVEGGLERTLADHVQAISKAIDVMREQTGRDVHLAGYSQGGMFCYQTAAYRRGEGLASLVTFGSPVDSRGVIPPAVPTDVASRIINSMTDLVLAERSIPAWLSRTGFKLMDPVRTVRQRIEFLLQLHNRDALLERENQRRFLESEGWVAWPGPALADFARQFIAHNRMLSGGYQIGDRLVTLNDVSCPVLCFIGTTDNIAPPPAVRAISRAAPRAELWESDLRAGHFGLVVGSKSMDITWPTVADWVHWMEGDGQRPEAIHELEEHPEEKESAGLDIGYGIDLAANVGIETARSVARTLVRGGRSLRDLAEEAVEQLPLVIRLQRVRSDTAISLGLLLDERAEKAPDHTFFLFEGRAHTYADAKRRIDNIVRGLLSVGVRQGDHVGVLMGTRPSALALIVALSRIGAIAVMLRPGGDLERELDLGGVSRVISDPEHAPETKEATDLPVLVLGGGGEPRELGFGLTDMERIDPDEVDVPAWYVPNPGRADDLAFLLFTGRGDTTRVNRITNRRWSLSAFGVASTAALEDTDTVYSLTPIHHPSGLLTSIGGAVAGGARIALATSFDPTTFWDEVRRYGVTIVSYTWTLCRDLVAAPSDPAERHHPVRLFVGSGMPSGLWQRVLDRFSPAGVLEFYASTEGEAVLGNVSGEKVGSKGRPVPGSADVALARYDLETERLQQSAEGLAIRCDAGEVGMLLARVDQDRAVSASKQLRSVFEAGDTWVSTGDLFRRDVDGDYWLVDHAPSVIRASTGPVLSVPIEDALGTHPAVDLAVAYGVVLEDGSELPAAAVTLRADRAIEPDDLDGVLSDLPDQQRPLVVRVVKELPLTAWHRPRKEPLRRAGLPTWTGKEPVWHHRDDRWLRLTRAGRDKLELA